MVVSWSDISDAFFYVSMAEMYLHSAILCRESGQIFYISDVGDSDELPEDIEDDEKYIAIPHKKELDLGKSLALDFTLKCLPDELERVQTIFHRKGAYSRFKDLLDRKGLLDDWYKYEETESNAALREWCRENKIEVKG